MYSTCAKRMAFKHDMELISGANSKYKGIMGFLLKKTTERQYMNGPPIAIIFCFLNECFNKQGSVDWCLSPFFHKVRC